MNWFVFSAVLIVYPLFGLALYLIRTRLSKIQNFSYTIFLPVGLSFILGIATLAYAVVNL